MIVKSPYKYKEFSGKEVCEEFINQWLSDHPNIEVASASLATNSLGWAYTILYRERKVVDEATGKEW